VHRDLDELTAVTGAGHVRGYRDGAPAGVFDQLAGGAQPILATCGQRHVGSRLGQCDCKADAQATRCASDDRDPIVNSKRVENGHAGFPFAIPLHCPICL